MARVANVQKTIRLFCTLFEDTGAPRPSAETLRMAKFNKEDAVGGMWSLLGQLIVLIRFLLEKRRIPRACSSDISWDGITRSEILYSLYACGYRRVKLFALCSVSASARELLLAFAWLLSHMQVFERLQHCYTDSLNADAVPCRPQERGLLAARDSDAAAYASPYSSSLKNCDVVRLFAGLHQQVESANRLSLSSEQALIRRTHAVHRHTLSAVKVAGAHGQVKAPHLTVHETHLLRHPKLLEEHLRVMELCTQGLANLLDWRQGHEQLFWQWMDSVVVLEGATGKADSVGGSSTSPQHPPQEGDSTVAEELPLPTYEEVHSMAQEEWATTSHQYKLAEPYMAHKGKGCPHRNTVQPSNTECYDEAHISLHRISNVMLLPQDMKDAKKMSRSFPSTASSIAEDVASLVKQKEALLAEIRELRRQAEIELDLLCSQQLPKNIVPYKPEAGFR